MTDDLVGRLRSVLEGEITTQRLIEIDYAVSEAAARIEALEAEIAKAPGRIDRAFEMGWRMATCSADRNSFDKLQQAIADYRTAISYEAPHAD